MCRLCFAVFNTRCTSTITLFFSGFLNCPEIFSLRIQPLGAGSDERRLYSQARRFLTEPEIFDCTQSVNGDCCKLFYNALGLVLHENVVLNRQQHSRKQ